MYRPVLVTAPAIHPVTQAEAKLHCRVDGTAENALIDGLIAAAVSHLDGWSGIMGRCLEEQEWRQDFDCFAQILRLPLDPVIEISSVTYRNTAGQLATVDSDDYRLLTDALGPHVRFNDDFDYPGDLNQAAAVSVEFVAGWEATGSPATSTLPGAIKAAILLMVGDLYKNREASVEGTVKANPAVKALLKPHSRIRV